jgi:hypothetical protein
VKNLVPAGNLLAYRKEKRVKKLALIAVVLVAFLAAAGPAEACLVCNDCVENPRTGFSYCRGSDEGAEHCGSDIWGSCWTYGNFCGCIVVY